jgi:hypothetical protein
MKCKEKNPGNLRQANTFISQVARELISKMIVRSQKILKKRRK